METIVNLDSKQAREILNISRTKYYELVHDPNFFPAFRVGRKILINREQLFRWMDEQKIRKGDNG